jgi:dTDP-glucose pyrophosphorylase
MRTFKDHLINKGSSVKQALELLNKLSPDPILFVVDQDDRLIGSLTDGDIRRGLLKNFTLSSQINEIIQPNPRFIQKGENDIQKIISYRDALLRILPVVDQKMQVVNVVNFRNIKSYLPIDAVIMAGGRGQRLQPLTDTIPKPLLKVGGKPIIEHNIDRLASYGIDNFWVSVNYLGEQIQQYFGDGFNKRIKIDYVWESNALGTIGAVSKVSNFEHDYVLVTNSDLLTNIDYEIFFLDFIKNEADFAVLTIPYKVSIPYAVLETIDGKIKSLKEKPTYTYYSNGGVYLMKREMLQYIPQNTYFNSTDLMESLINQKFKVISYPFSGYWLDVGRHEDFEKAQIDVQDLKF